MSLGPIRLAQLLAAGEVSSVDLTRWSLAEIEATQPTVNAFRRVRADAAFRDAAAADRRLRAGERAPLLGVPIAVKDDVDVAGEPTGYGTAWPVPPAAEDGVAVRRLKDAGAVIMGKTNMPELGQWPFTEGTAFGVTRNPWQPERTPGGSSGGSAAAVAAGLVAAAVGSDGAGSVRIPAAWTHLVGIKPRRGRIIGDGTPDAFQGSSTLGPLARTTADAALLLDVLAGTDPNAPESLRAEAERAPGRLRVAVSLRPPFTGVRSGLDPQVRAAVHRLAAALAELGHDVRADEPRYGLVGMNFLARSAGGLHKSLGAAVDANLLDPTTRRNIVTGRRVGNVLRGLVAPTEFCATRQVGRIFDRVDVLLTPTTAVPPPEVGAWRRLDGRALNRTIRSACPYTWPWNALGWPAVNVPAGRTDDGAPVGCQLLGPYRAEALLIRLAAQLERHQRWPELHPPMRRST